MVANFKWKAQKSIMNDFHPQGNLLNMLDGEVSLIEEDMYYTRGTIFFDHGHA